MVAGRIIRIKPVATGAAAAAENAHARLTRAGFLRMMDIGEPRLSEFVALFKARGYEVEVWPFVDKAAGGQGGCSTGSHTAEETIPIEETAVEFGTIYVRKVARPAGDKNKNDAAENTGM